MAHYLSDLLKAHSGQPTETWRTSFEEHRRCFHKEWVQGAQFHKTATVPDSAEEGHWHQRDCRDQFLLGRASSVVAGCICKALQHFLSPNQCHCWGITVLPDLAHLHSAGAHTTAACSQLRGLVLEAHSINPFLKSYSMQCVSDCPRACLFPH